MQSTTAVLLNVLMLPPWGLWGTNSQTDRQRDIVTPDYNLNWPQMPPLERLELIKQV